MEAGVPEFYQNETVFITGATGFVGKALLEKLMRSCSGIKKFYLLVRPRGELAPEDRVTELLDQELFSRAKKEHPEMFSRVEAIPGELCKENLGMSEDVLNKLRSEVTIVFHVAATVKFTENLKVAVNLNVLAPLRVLQFCKSLNTCHILVHVSTAYAHTNRNVIEEVVYPSFDYQKLIDLVSLMDAEMADLVTPKLITDRPNTYTFTKSVAEHMISREGHGLPIAIVRPSIVVSTWREPFPGWTDNYNGPSGLALAVGTGVLKVIPGRYDAVCDMIPVDVVANFTACSAWYTLKKLGATGDTGPVVFNCTSGSWNPTTWGLWGDVITKTFKKYPLENRVLRRPSIELCDPESRRLKWLQMLYHTVPGNVLDWIVDVQGKKPQLTKAYGKIDRIMAEYAFFTTQSWTWDIKHGEQMLAALNESDRQTFNFDMKHLHWPSFVEQVCVGLKKYLMREDMARVHVGLRIQRRLMIINLLVKTVGLALLARFLLPYLRKYGLARSFWLFLLPAVLMTKA